MIFTILEYHLNYLPNFFISQFTFTFLELNHRFNLLYFLILIKIITCGDFPGDPVVTTLYSQCRRSPVSVPGQGTRSHMPQLRPDVAK